MGSVATIDEYIEEVQVPLQDVAAALRPIIDAGLPTAKGQIWHGNPVWMIGKTPVAMFKAYPRYVTFSLFKGQKIEDPTGKLEAGSQSMASIKLTAPNEIDQPAIADWLLKAAALER
ncbi:hypothetical protein BH09CHL1_BH09CHL1_08940 [soil metagenome]